MFIKNVHINGFGKLNDKDIEFKNGLNIIEGSNESGKSTLANFIRCMFYGISKNKDGNKFSDFERYKPWSDIPFGGQITYEYDNKEYTIHRDLNKTSSKVYDAEGNDITNNFNKDRARGVEVGISHLKIDEETFNNSFLVRQSETEVDNSEQRSIIQKITNMVQTGDEGVSYEKTKSKLEKLILDEVGTSRTQNKPINVVNREIANYSNMKNELIRNKNRDTQIDNEIKDLKEKQIKYTKSYIEAKKVYDVRKKYEDLLEEKHNAYETAKKLMKKERDEYEKLKKRRLIEGIVIIAVLFVALVCALIIFKKYVYAVAAALICICVEFLYRELEKQNEKEYTELNFDITKEELNKKEQKELDDLIKDGVKTSLIDRKAQALKDLIDGYEKSKNEATLEEHKLEIEKNSLKNDVVKITEIEEKLQDALERKKDIERKEESLKMAIDALDEAYNEIKEEVVPEIALLVKEAVAKTTNGEYSEILYNDSSGLLAKNTNGELISIDKLSIGTIDQIYLGFRLAISNKLDNIPLILDDTFVFYDNERLENILKTLVTMSNEKQIIILTCSNRENSILEKLKIKDMNIISL